MTKGKKQCCFAKNVFFWCFCLIMVRQKPRPRLASWFFAKKYSSRNLFKCAFLRDLGRGGGKKRPWVVDPFLGHFPEISLIWGTKLADSFRVHLFYDLGVEMLPESGGCMCYNHRNSFGCWMVSFFHLFTNWVSWGRVWGVILKSFGDLVGTFCDIWRYWEQAWNLLIFQGFPGRPQAESIHPFEGNVFLQLGSK